MFRHIAFALIMLLACVGMAFPLTARADNPPQQSSCGPQISEPYIVSQREQYQLLIPYVKSDQWKLDSIKHQGLVEPAITFEKEDAAGSLEIRFFTDVSGEMYPREKEPNVSRMLTCVFTKFLEKKGEKEENTIQIDEEPKDILRFGFETLETNDCAKKPTARIVLVSCFHQQVQKGKLDYKTLENLKQQPNYATEVQILFRLRGNALPEEELQEIVKHNRMIVLDFSLTQDQAQRHMWMPLMDKDKLTYPNVPCNDPTYIGQLEGQFNNLRDRLNRFRSGQVIRAKTTRLITKKSLVSRSDSSQPNLGGIPEYKSPYEVVFMNPTLKQQCSIPVFARLPAAHKPSNEVPVRSRISRIMNTVTLPLALIGTGMLGLWVVGLVRRSIRDQAYKWLWEKWP